jgi:DNA-binding CsgD family transcriptional regulator
MAQPEQLHPVEKMSAEEVLRLADDIRAQKSTAEVLALLWELNDVIGADGCVFASFSRDDDTMESYKYLVACPAAWCHEYNENHWFAIDPCFVYGASNTEPTLIQDLPLRSKGQQKMIAAAANAGFRSGVVVPVHSAKGRSRMGLLYVGSGDAGRFNKNSLGELRLAFRVLGAELLDWFINKVKADLLSQVNLKDDEKQILNLVHRGLRSREIGLLCGFTKDAVDQKLSRLATRFNTSGKQQTATLAFENGLLD